MEDKDSNNYLYISSSSSSPSDNDDSDDIKKPSPSFCFSPLNQALDDDSESSWAEFDLEMNIPSKTTTLSCNSTSWKQAVSKEGKVYYYHPVTRETKWSLDSSNSSILPSQYFKPSSLFCCFCGNALVDSEITSHLKKCSANRKKNDNDEDIIAKYSNALACVTKESVREYASSIVSQSCTSLPKINLLKKKTTRTSASEQPLPEPAPKSRIKSARRKSLLQSFNEQHRVKCPNCNRSFAPSAADRHIEICKKVNENKKYYFSASFK